MCDYQRFYLTLYYNYEIKINPFFNKKSLVFMVKKDSELCKLINILKKDNASSQLIKWFSDAYNYWLLNKNIDKYKLSNLDPVKKEDVPSIDLIHTSTNESVGIENLAKVITIKLNGGLGTSMGCTQPKSLVAIDGNDTFLDITIKQLSYIKNKYHTNIPLYLMNSFYTHRQTINQLKRQSIESFLQDRIPRIAIDSKTAVLSHSNDIDWCPPGHGNIFMSLWSSGMLDTLLSQGKEYAFISNSDNLGAVFNAAILGYVISSKCPFLMEVTPKTQLDIKGGSVVKRDNTYMLLERAQVAETELAQFEDISKFQLFNTNNIWVHLPTIKKQLVQNTLDLQVIFNTKNIDNTKIVQFETAMGSAIHCVEGASLLCVARDRFLPVKKTVDLLLLSSDIYVKNEAGIISKQSTKACPVIQLDEIYSDIDVFKTYFKVIPSIKELDQLTIKGLFLFNKKINLAGSVKLVNTTDKPIEITDSLENVTLTF
ncbi:hypothetical protein DID76_01155 [Candidatus Marinamargulisbacteria bacterium SCGC AG-414-C22]|nr:hypothetical protein DID76_01155 [Candidatus Marinamargulisbacteria bacterium SCGC AG-414-C22]